MALLKGKRFSWLSLAGLVIPFVGPIETTQAAPVERWDLNSIGVVIEFDSSKDQLSVFDAAGNRSPYFVMADVKKSVRVGFGNIQFNESRGSFQVKEDLKQSCALKNIAPKWDSSQEMLSLEAEIEAQGSCKGQVTIKLFASLEEQVSFQVIPSVPVDYIEISPQLMTQESIHGFGQQFSYYDFRGKVVPILSQEQGIGRGKPLVTRAVNLLAKGSGGHEFSTYFAMPYFITDQVRGFFLENSEYASFDFSKDSKPLIRVHASQVLGRILIGQSMLDLIENYTAYTGRFLASPDWVHEGAILGITGGTTKVWDAFNESQKQGVPLSAVWIQDWPGIRKTMIGKQVWWNWQLDETHYDRFDDFRAALAAKNVRLLGYINPYIVENSTMIPGPRNLFQESIDGGFVVMDHQNKPYLLTNTDFVSTVVDLTNPQATRWLKDVIKDEMIDQGFSGWMADYGEGMPFDGKLHDGSSPYSFHNQYPVEWSRLNAEAIAEAGQEDEILTFSRSGFTRSPGFTRMNWIGDQLTTWDHHDGLKSAVKAMLNSGLSGISLSHSDIGGYTTIRPLGIKRTAELLARWSEFAAFTPLMRTHEGNQPDVNVQVYTDEKQWQIFARNSKIYRALSQYRKKLFTEAHQFGRPLMRHPILYHPGLSCFRKEDSYSYFYGKDLFVAPVVDPGVKTLEVQLPPGHWRHLWTGQEYQVANGCQAVKVTANLGQIPVFLRQGSSDMATFVAALSKEGLTVPK